MTDTSNPNIKRISRFTQPEGVTDEEQAFREFVEQTMDVFAELSLGGSAVKDIRPPMIVSAVAGAMIRILGGVVGSTVSSKAGLVEVADLFRDALVMAGEEVIEMKAKIAAGDTEVSKEFRYVNSVGATSGTVH